MSQVMSCSFTFHIDAKGAIRGTHT